MPLSSNQATYSPSDRTTQIGSFNSPDITDSGTIRNRPVSSYLQAFNIFQRFERQNIHRAMRNAQVARAYNGEHPFDQSKLNAAGQGWRSNWSTLPFANTVDRVKPRFTKAESDQKYLTNSTLPDSYPDASKKTDSFQEKTTRCIRQWSGWKDFIERVATENLIFGYTGAVHLSQYDWRARTFREEDLLFDERAPSHAGRLDCFVVKVDYYIHELLEILDNQEYAEDLGYEVDNIINAIRYAMPPRDSLVYNPRQLIDMVRQGSYSYSHQKEARMVQTAHLFVRNYEGKIDHWWFNRSTLARGHQDGDKAESTDTDGEHEGIGLLFCEAYASSMEDVVTLFSFEPGDGSLHGSKGMGRKLYNVSLAMDKLRNTMYDNLYLASLIMGTMDSSKIAAMQPVVKSPFMQMPDGFVMATQPQMIVNMEAFEYAGNQLQALLDQIAGTFMPDQYSASTGNHITDTTATEASLDAAREDEIKQGVLNRWWSQVQECVQAQQRRMYSKENIQAAIEFKTAKDEAQEKGQTMVSQEVIEVISAISGDVTDSYVQEPDLMNADIKAVETIVSLMEDGLSPEEIYVLSRQSATNFTANVGAAEDQRIIQFIQAVQANPQFAAYFDQEKMAKMGATAAIGATKTEELFQPLPEQTTNIAADRQQKMEFQAMIGGEPMPVDARDPHELHLQTLGGKMMAWIQTMHQMPPIAVPHEQLVAFKLMIEHEGDHLQKMLELGNTKESLKNEFAVYQEHEQALKDIADKMQKAAQAQQALQDQAAANQPPPGPGTPSGPYPAMSVPPGMFPPGQQGMVPQQLGPGAGVQPMTQQAAPTVPANGQSQPVPQSAIPDHAIARPKTPKDAAGLPSGMHFMDPHGKRRVRP